MAYPQPQRDPTAVFGRRVLAVFIDLIVIMVPLGLIATADFEYLTTETLESQGTTGEDFCDAMNDRGDFCVPLTDVDGVDAAYFSEGWSATTQAGFWLLPFAYLVLVQAFTGWTLGKLITGIRTVREDGRAPGFVKALLRWLLWIVDGFPYFIPGLVGFIVGLTTVGHRRVGDMAAKTFVVRRADAGSPVVVPGLTTPTLAAGAPWGTAPPPGAGAPGGWPSPQDPAAAGWASPTTPPPPAATPPPTPVATEGPQWDEARGTYIQWDPAQRAWMQWDEGFKAWSRIPGQ